MFITVFSSTQLNILLEISLGKIMRKSLISVYFFFSSLESFFLFVIFLVLIILLIISLWRNIRHMQHNISSLSNPNTEVHAGAVRALISFIFYVLYFVASVVSMIMVAVVKIPVKTPGYGWFVKSWWTCISVDVVVLTLVNPKLKEASVRLLHWAKCYLRQETW